MPEFSAAFVAGVGQDLTEALDARLWSESPSREFLAIGVDPGPTPGIVALRWSGVLLEHVHVIQCSHGIAPSIVTWLLNEDGHPDLRAVVQTERFVVGRGSGKSGKAGAITRDLVGAIEREVGFHAHSVSGHPASVVQENASRAKSWATDARLAATRASGQDDLLELVKGMRHAKDGARHALFASVQHGGIPDPLSKHSTTPTTRGPTP